MNKHPKNRTWEGNYILSKWVVCFVAILITLCELLIYYKYIPSRVYVGLIMTALYIALYYQSIFYFSNFCYKKSHLVFFLKRNSDFKRNTLRGLKYWVYKLFWKNSGTIKEIERLSIIPETQPLTKKYYFIRKDEDELVAFMNILYYFFMLALLLLLEKYLVLLGKVGSILYILLLFPLIFCTIILFIATYRKTFGNTSYSIENPYNLLFVPYFLVLFLIVCWGRNSFVHNFGNKKISSWFDGDKYTARYFVNVFPSIDNGLNYRLPAYVNIVYNKNNFISKYLNILIDKSVTELRISWPDGKELELSKTNISSFYKDKSGAKFYIEITDEMVTDFTYIERAPWRIPWKKKELPF